MDVKVVTDSDADALLVYVFETEGTLGDDLTSLDSTLNGAVRDVVEGGDFSGKAAQTCVLYPRGALKSRRVILVGLGKQADFTVDKLRRAAATGVKKARELKAKRVASQLIINDQVSVKRAAHAITEGVLLGAYTYRGQKTEADTNTPIETLELVTESAAEAEQGVAIGKAFATGAITSRNLINLPPNICTPIHMAKVAKQVAQQSGLRCEALEKNQIEALRMGAFLAVAQGSSHPPRFIILEHNADRAEELDTIVLVGKGVTFDTGGYSIKTNEGMVGMKADMSGAAAVIGAMQTIAMLNIPLHVVGLAPCGENMISSKAFRVQDVITAGNGKTIEVVNTDAEGRLLLADALVYAKRYNPAAVVDIATLTGACVVALGSQAAGLFVTDNTLRDKLMAAADETSERLWQLPLFPEYKKTIESDTADIKNSAGRTAGVGASAVFLQQFVDYPAWAHIDMAGVMLDVADNPYYSAKGGSGYGTRLLAEFARQWAGQD